MTLKEEVTPSHCVKFMLDMIRCVKIQGTNQLLSQQASAVRCVGECPLSPPSPRQSQSLGLPVLRPLGAHPLVPCARLPDTPGLQCNVLMEMMKIVRDVGPCSDVFARGLQEYERRAILR